MSYPPVIVIHADLLARAGWHMEPNTSFCSYYGLIVFWCREPGAAHIGFPLTSPVMFSFFLPIHAWRVRPRMPSDSQQQTPPVDELVEHGEPIPIVPIRVVSPHRSFDGGPVRGFTST